VRRQQGKLKVMSSTGREAFSGSCMSVGQRARGWI
jgi:hypothetical protein